MVTLSELCRIHADKARSPTKAVRVSFQNLEGARTHLLDLFTIDLSAGTSGEDWLMLAQALQRRHVLAHRMGVVDDAYVAKTGDVLAVAGRKVRIGEDEVRDVAIRVRALALTLARLFQRLAARDVDRTA